MTLLSGQWVARSYGSGYLESKLGLKDAEPGPFADSN